MSGGGWTTPYWASPWYSPSVPSATIEGRSAFTGEDAAVQPRDYVPHERRTAHRSHRHAPVPEQ
jgi:hypothetical protein